MMASCVLSLKPAKLLSMFSLLKKMFGKAQAPLPAPLAVVATAIVRPASPSELGQPMAQVEVAHLSLAAILGRLPQDLKNNVAQSPDAAATVALPLATIHKQLPTGSVKMSLASLYRQAPAGTFRQARAEDKRMIEVPLNEVFRHVNPQSLRRRPEQRSADLPEAGIHLFGDKNNPFALAPIELEPTQRAFAPEALPEVADVTAPEPASAAAENVPAKSDRVPEPQRMIKPTFSFGAAAPAVPAARAEIPANQPKPLRAAVPVAAVPAEKAIAPSAPSAAETEPALLLPIADLATNWPEPIRSEALALNGSKVALPAAAVTAGLARGKVTFTWAQVRAWLTPPPATPTQAREGTELVLPLKVVAPAFLKQKKPAPARKTAGPVDDAIPTLFSGTQPLAEPAPQPDPALPEDETAKTAPRALAEQKPATVAAPAIPEPAAAPTLSEPVAQTVGELFGQPDKAHWSPQDLIHAAVRLPGVAGAIVALQEGLIVAAELPETLKGDTLAAFLPQMFARINAYAGEMKLGSIEDLLFTTAGAHFQAYRIGEVYFAVLGKPSESLPWENLRVIAAELARHTNL